MSIAEIQKMSVIERIKVMEEIWDSLCHEDTEIESPDWHKNVLEERRKLLNSGEANLISIKDLKNKKNNEV